jgi:hypothetical protein
MSSSILARLDKNPVTYGVQSAHLINLYKLLCFCTFLYINCENDTFPLLMRLRIRSREREENMVISSIHNHRILTFVTSIDKFVISLYILIDMYWLSTSSLYKLSTTFLSTNCFFGVKFFSLPQFKSKRQVNYYRYYYSFLMQLWYKKNVGA